MLANLGRILHRKSGWFLGAGAIFLIIAGTYGTGVFDKLASGGFDSPGFESYQAAHETSDHFGGSQQSLLVLFHSEHGLQVTDSAYQRAVENTLQVAHQDKRVVSVTDYYTTHAPQLVSRDGASTYAVVRISGGLDEATATTKTLRSKLTSPALQIKTGGTAAINQDFTTQIGKDLVKAETISFILLAILLLVVFRGLVAALLPLTLGAFGVLGAFLVVRLLTNVMSISQYAINVIILMGLGLAIDYSLFMVSRFREELRLGSVEEALATTMATAGRTVLFSGLTVILSLLGLLIFPISFLQSMGVGASAAVLVAMVSALTVLPALMGWLGHRVNALSFGRVSSKEERRSVWYWVAGGAMRWPVVSIALIVIPMAFLAQHFLLAKFATPDYRSLPDNAQSRQVAESLNNNFPGGNGNPIQIVIHESGDALAPSNQTVLRSYSRTLTALPGVTHVTSSTSDDYALINVTYNSNYDQPLATSLVKDIRSTPQPSGWDVKTGGVTAALVDLLNCLQHYAPYALLAIAIALFVLLFLMLGSWVIPLQALFVNTLSLSATFGVLVWIFQDGHLSRLLGFTSVGSIDATQPVLIFGIAFGLSMDYTVFLLSRIKEQYDATGDTLSSIREGIQKTGTIITSAALLFIVVVSAFATSAIPLIKQIGVGLGLAVFFDAFVIRMLLVPAIMRVFNRQNWWAPKLLKRPRGV